MILNTLVNKERTLKIIIQYKTVTPMLRKISISILFTLSCSVAFAVPTPPEGVPIDDAVPFLAGAGILYLAKRFGLFSKLRGNK